MPLRDRFRNSVKGIPQQVFGPCPALRSDRHSRESHLEFEVVPDFQTTGR